MCARLANGHERRIDKGNPGDPARINEPRHVAEGARMRLIKDCAARRSFAATLLSVLATVVFAGVGLAAAPAAQAKIVFDGSPGTAAPPATLGPYTMTPFAADPRQTGNTVNTVPSPLFVPLWLFPAQIHVQVGNYSGIPYADDWATWSNGYTGDVYWNNEQTMTMILPPDTGAFYFYAEPYLPFGSSFTISATSQNGSSGPVSVATSSGATYYGFYATGLDWVTSIKITSNCCSNGFENAFGVGEFGIARYNPALSLAGFSRPRTSSTTSWR